MHSNMKLFYGLTVTRVGIFYLPGFMSIPGFVCDLYFTDFILQSGIVKLHQGQAPGLERKFPVLSVCKPSSVCRAAECSYLL